MLASHPELFQYPAAARRFPVHHIHRAWRQWRNCCHRPHPLRQRRRQRWPRHQHRHRPQHRWRQRRWRRCWWRQWCRKQHRKRLRKSRLRPGGAGWNWRSRCRRKIDMGMYQNQSCYIWGMNINLPVIWGSLGYQGLTHTHIISFHREFGILARKRWTFRRQWCKQMQTMDVGVWS